MEYTHVGHLGLVVSRLCLGTMNFGPHTPESDSYAIMDSAVAYGINFFDTANVFGRHLGVGATEEIIGRWFTKGDGRRDKVVLATKVYGTMGDWPNESRLSKLGIRRRARSPSGDCVPTGSTCIRCTTSTASRGGTRSGRRWSSSSGRARCSTSARPTSPDGISPARTRSRGWRNTLGLVSEQSPYNLMRATGRARGDPRDPGVRHGLDRVQPAGRRVCSPGALEKVNEGRRSQGYMQGEIE